MKVKVTVAVRSIHIIYVNLSNMFGNCQYNAGIVLKMNSPDILLQKT